jgi:hypothetical protein
MITRRHFFQLSGLSLLASRASFAIEPFRRAGTARLQLSLAAYSFREFFKDQQGKIEPCREARHVCVPRLLRGAWLRRRGIDELLLPFRRDG